MSITRTQDSFEQFGPRLDNLLIKTYDNASELFDAFEAGDIDVMNQWDLPRELIENWSQPPYNELIGVKKYSQSGAYFLDINNNETISAFGNWRSPTSYVEIRQAIAHLINKTKIVEGILGGYGLPLETPVMPWTEWFNPDVDTYPYDPLEAASILDGAGFVQGTTPNPYYDPSKPGSAQYIRIYPPDHEKAGEDLDTLIFYVRQDHSERNQTGYMIRDELLSVGIPVEIPGPVIIQQIAEKVMILQEYHLYTGGWTLTADPDYMYSLYHSEMYWWPGFCINYNHLSDEELDHWLEILCSSMDKETARNASFNAQTRLAEIVGVIPLWSPMYAKAYRKYSDRAPCGWEGIINKNGEGVNNWWTFLNAHAEDQEQGGTMIYGFSEDVLKLNPAYSEWYTDWDVLDKIYEPLMRCDPITNSHIPWLAKSWEIENYSIWEGIIIDQTPFTGPHDGEKQGVAVKIHLREDVYWHDGEPFTSEDVKYTIELFATDQTIWWYDRVPPFTCIDISDSHTVIFHLQEPLSFNLWWIYQMGSTIILPKHIWENIPVENLTAFAPDPNLIGTGPYKFVEYVEDSHILLESNQQYFKYCSIQAEVDAKTRRIDPMGSLNFSISIFNHFKDKTVNVTVSIYLNESHVDTATLSLASLSSVELGPYNTGSVPCGFYQIRVEHSADHYLGRSCISTFDFWVTLRENIKRDLKVDMKDIALAALAFGASPGDRSGRWNILADVNGDYKVDMRDIGAISRKFGWRG
jgi:ABC-type transport system substrate-binding protein